MCDKTNRPVISSSRSAKVLFPWSIWAMMQKFLILSAGNLERSTGSFKPKERCFAMTDTHRLLQSVRHLWKPITAVQWLNNIRNIKSQEVLDRRVFFGTQRTFSCCVYLTLTVWELIVLKLLDNTGNFFLQQCLARVYVVLHACIFLLNIFTWKTRRKGASHKRLTRENDMFSCCQIV